MTTRGSIVLALLCAGAVGAAPPPQAPTVRGQFAFAREVVPGGVGPNRLDLDITVLGGGQPFTVSGGPDALERTASAGLGDLRLFDQRGTEIPYLLIDAPSRREARLRVPLALSRRPSEPGRSRFRLALPSPHLPLVALVFEIPDGYLSRQVTVTEAHLAGRAVEPRTLGTAVLVSDPRTPPPLRRLRVPIDPPRESELQIEVDDGDNPPLSVSAVTGECAPLPWIYFEARSTAPLIARYGDSRFRAPVYDLEAARERIAKARTATARWGEARPLAVAAEAPLPPLPTAAGPPVPLEGFRYRRAITAGPAQLVAVPLDASVLAHSSYSLAGYGLSGEFADVRVLDDQHRQVPYLVERLPEPQSVPVALAPASGAEAPAGVTVYDLVLPVRGLAPSTLVLRTNARVFRREVRVEVPRAADARHRDAWVETVAAAPWRHDSPDVPEPGVALSLSQFAGDASEVRLVVMEGDNAPLPIGSAELLLPAYRVRFYRPPDVPLTLAYGDPKLAAPEYDLALLGVTVLGAAATEVNAGPEQAVPPARTAPVVPPAAFWAVISLAAAVLGWLIVVLVRRSDA